MQAGAHRPPVDAPFGEETLEGLGNEEVSEAGTVLKAHENLVRADKDNAPKFQDVIAFLRNQVEEDKE